MDVELARTFLTIVRTRSFVRAAEDLNVSQTTVSARIRSLEEQLRRPLFLRGRHGVSLTPAGEQFLRYAPDIVQLWQRARQQVTVPRGRRALLTIGTELGLWQPWLVEWLRFMRRTVPDVALRARIHPAEELVDAVAAGTLDLAVAYAPRHLPGVRIELLMEERLILVTTASDGAVDPDSYVQVDWGHDFAARFDPGLPAGVDPGLSIDLGPLALAYLLEAGGSGYFRQRAAAPHIASGRLHPVPGAPSFSYPVYAVRPAGTSDELVEHALAGLRHTTDADGASPSDIQPDGILR